MTYAVWSSWAFLVARGWWDGCTGEAQLKQATRPGIVKCSLSNVLSTYIAISL